MPGVCGQREKLQVAEFAFQCFQRLGRIISELLDPSIRLGHVVIVKLFAQRYG